MRYRRSMVPGGTFFFTLNLADRSADLLVRHIAALRAAHQHVSQRHPFAIEATVILPDHLHAIWTLPEGDTNYATRWMLIKAALSRAIPRTESIGLAGQPEENEASGNVATGSTRSAMNMTSQLILRTFITTLKHGRAKHVADWPHSSFHRYVKQGLIAADWAGDASCTRRSGEVQAKPAARAD